MTKVAASVLASSPGLQRKGGGLVHTAGVLVRMRNYFPDILRKIFCIHTHNKRLNIAEEVCGIH